MKKYSVKQLSGLAKVSVRTLHYYDEIGLLKPGEKSAAGYRSYVREDLFKLQQIMFFKELGFSLDEIQRILGDPDFDLKKALKSQREEISKRLVRFKKLLNTIDKTIQTLNQKSMLTDKEMYEGFTPEQAEAYRKEASQRWGDEVKASEARIKKMSKEQWNAVKAEGEAITKKLAELMTAGSAPESPEVQSYIARWHKHLENFYPVSEERLSGLGQMYIADERFTAHYDQYAKGLAQFKNTAIQIYCDNGMKTS